MAWHLAISDMPGRPYAVIDGNGNVAGCHASRASAAMQMTQLNLDGDGACAADMCDDKDEDEKSDKKSGKKSGTDKDMKSGTRPPEKHQDPPVAYTTPTTQCW